MREERFFSLSSFKEKSERLIVILLMKMGKRSDEEGFACVPDLVFFIVVLSLILTRGWGRGWHHLHLHQWRLEQRRRSGISQMKDKTPSSFVKCIPVDVGRLFLQDALFFWLQYHNITVEEGRGS